MRSGSQRTAAQSSPPARGWFTRSRFSFEGFPFLDDSGDGVRCDSDVIQVVTLISDLPLYRTIRGTVDQEPRIRSMGAPDLRRIHRSRRCVDMDMTSHLADVRKSEPISLMLRHRTTLWCLVSRCRIFPTSVFGEHLSVVCCEVLTAVHGSATLICQKSPPSVWCWETDFETDKLLCRPTRVDER